MNAVLLVSCVLLSTIGMSAVSATLQPANCLVLNPQPHDLNPFAMSFLSCDWQGNSFSCPTYHSFDGTANFVTNGAQILPSPEEHRMVIMFQQEYLRAPVCNFNFQDFNGQVRIRSESDRVFLSLQNSAGQPVAWNSVQTGVHLSCFGVTSDPAGNA
eukprot:m.310151 g.310151  ORF g.310151 m.310151 type:complete len:157 (+) comp49827_c0_seq1:149-619(+)